MANRDVPVNGKRSKLSLLKSGKLVLTDANRIVVWATDTFSYLSVSLHLNDLGNLVLTNSEHVVLWQSFDSPTDTLLPLQPLTRTTKLVSSRSQSNVSSGFYTFYFDNNNLLSLLFDNQNISSVYWPSPWLVSWEAGRSTYNSSRVAILNSFGNFSSSDDLTFLSTEYGSLMQRRLKVDYDGNVRLYSRKKAGDEWSVSWQAFSEPCQIHGICGPNGLCSYVPGSGKRKCSCLPGYEIVNHTDWSFGCQPTFKFESCSRSDSKFHRVSSTDFYGYDYGFFPNKTYNECVDLCLKLCNCKGFQYKFSFDKGYKCFPKTLLLNGFQTPNISGDIYLRFPIDYNIPEEKPHVDFSLNCANQSDPSNEVLLDWTYNRKPEHQWVTFMLWIVSGLGGLEIVCFLIVCCVLFRTQRNEAEDMRGYLLATAGFKRFSFAELKKATKGFKREIGRGAGGIVYKGVLSDARVAAIKRLDEVNQGEAEFLAEVNTIGRLNHMHLIEMWGYCSEGKHKLLVYEYMELGSLKQNLSSDVLDWKKRFEIAAGTAKGLAYLHEECLEWILHCDVKPQNILLDSNYQPKVADFGLSKLLSRGEISNPSVSRVRGTRGYLAPEWVSNQPITSKVDVYSYGIVVLEMLTGKSPIASVQVVNSRGETEHRRLVSWVRDNIKETSGLWLEKIIDPSMNGEYNVRKMEMLVEVALKCVEDDKDARPTMSQVVEMLEDH
nr:putative receptor protein kinase ZmPK1 isoform X1 [Ziziphus jujuba var. spinosa]